MRNLIIRLLIAVVTLSMGQYVLCAETQPAANPGSMTASQLEKAGDLARSNKDFEEAIDYFTTAIRRDGKNAVLYNKRGLTYLRLNNLRGAKYDFQKSVKLNSKFADAINNIGAVYYMQKDYGAASRQFKKAVALDETRATFHVNLGASWFAQKKLDRALAEYARALELNPDALATGNAGVTAQIASPEERARYAFMLAKIFAQRGDADQCIKNLRKAKEEGYRELASIYKDAEFASVRNDPRLAEISPPPAN
jgi:tetratricopeptide (TPR) repeat protein